MQQKIISGTIQPPEEQKQKQLHRQIRDFTCWMKQSKDTAEILKNQRKSVPVNQLPMVF